MKRRLAGAYFVAIMAAYAAVILAAPAPPPFVDYPDWVYQGVLFHLVLTGHPAAGYALKPYPVPNSLTTAALGVLGLFLRWDWAGKVWECCYLALASFASWSLARALRAGDWRLTLALPALLFLNLVFWNGDVAVETGMCLVMLLLAMLLRGATTAAISAMLVLLFFTHMEACGAALLLVLLWSFFARDRRLPLAILPASALTVWYALARYLRGNLDGRALLHADYPYGSGSFFLYKANTLFKTFGYVNARTPSGLSISEAIFGRPLFCLLLAASLCLALLAWWSMLRGLRSAAPVLRWSVILLLLLALALPQVWLGVADPGTRLLLIACSIALFLVDWRQPAGTAIAWLSVFLCVANLWQFAAIERNPFHPGQPRDLPAPVLVYGHMEPAERLLFYDELRSGRRNIYVFETGLFVNAGR
jgi:hypothetical protein